MERSQEINERRDYKLDVAVEALLELSNNSMTCSGRSCCCGEVDLEIARAALDKIGYKRVKDNFGNEFMIKKMEA